MRFYHTFCLISTSDEYLARNIAKTSTTVIPKQTKYDKNLELVRNFFWYHGRLDKRTACELLEQNGQFLVRSARSKVDHQIKTVLSVKWNNRHYHFGIKKSGEYFIVEELQFDSVIHLISFYFTSKHPLTKRSNAILLQPIFRYIEMDTPYILKGTLNLAFACIIVIFLYVLFTIN